MGILAAITDLLFPPKCMFCRKILRGGDGAACKACEAELTGHDDVRTGTYFSRCVIPMAYEGKVRDAIIRFKFQDQPGYATEFGRILAKCIQNEFAGQYDLITWIPVSGQRLKKRGYDQAMLLAMAAALELGDVAVETLRKTADNPAQSSLTDAAARKTNVQGAYTVPVFVEYRGIVKPNDSHVSFPTGHTLSQPWADGFFIKPFTRPKTVSVEFDKWNKKNVVTWTRQDEAKGYNGHKEQNVACRYDGKWYVIRYAKGGSATDYTLIKTLNGDASSLQLTDEGIDYNKEYTYRVIFLPSIMENKYREDLAQLPGYGNGSTPTDYDLWNTASISTKLEVPIRLTQDKTYDKDVFLKWKYSIPTSGLSWYIDYKDTNGTTWLTKSDAMSVDPNQTEASIHFSGTVCDPVTYRIRTTIGGTNFYSDTLSTTLPSGSYISDVTATTGTEETEVKVKWKVKNPDIVNDIYYRVLRRPIGAEGPDSWTELSSGSWASLFAVPPVPPWPPISDSTWTVRPSLPPPLSPEPCS